MDDGTIAVSRVEVKTHRQPMEAWATARPPLPAVLTPSGISRCLAFCAVWHLAPFGI
jgi:hypothetical protein